jgi:hypothetical protein
MEQYVRPETQTTVEMGFIEERTLPKRRRVSNVL